MSRALFRRGLRAALAVLIAGSCGPVSPEPPPPVPMNSCPENPCEKFSYPASLAQPSCTAGACTSVQNIDFALVLSLPESSFKDEGVTFTIPSWTAFKAKHPLGCGQVVQSTPPCFQIPAAARLSGKFIVSGGVQDYTDVPLPHPGAWLAAFMEFRPVWPVLAGTSSMPTTTWVDAAQLGLPLLPVVAQNSSTIGPADAPGTEWAVELDGNASYRMYGAPVDPRFPAVIAPNTGPLAGLFNGVTTNLEIDSLDPEVTTKPNGNTTFSVTRDGSLEGFAVYLRDVATGLRVSSLATLHGETSASATLLTAFESPYAGKGTPVGGPRLDIVVQPPDGLAIPTLADPVIIDVLKTTPFPALPAPVLVSGTVRSGGQPIQAALVIDSKEGGIVTNNPDDPSRPHMSYATALETDTGGGYFVPLPPGAYDVFITPAFGADAGAASVPLDVQVPLPGQPAFAAGKDLIAAAPATVEGIVALADQRLFAGALIDVRAATSLARSVDPRRWPRGGSVTADAQGRFSIAVDPGTYDVVVEPPLGTAFPWVTLTSRDVAAGATLDLGTIVVSAPISLEVVLHDDSDIPLANTLVRAYAQPVGGTAETSPVPFVELGAWMTDDVGHVTMFVVPP